MPSLPLKDSRPGSRKSRICSSAKLACHAALPALDSPETAAAATAVLERVIVIPIPATRESFGDGEVDRRDSSGPSKDAGLPVSAAQRAGPRTIPGQGRRRRQQARRRDARGGTPGQTDRYSRLTTSGRAGLRVALIESVAAGQWSVAWDLLGQWLDSIWNGFEATSRPRTSGG